MDIILWPQIYQKYRQMVRASPLLIISGRVQRDGEAVCLLADRVEPLSL